MVYKGESWDPTTADIRAGYLSVSSRHQSGRVMAEFKISIEWSHHRADEKSVTVTYHFPSLYLAIQSIPAL